MPDIEPMALTLAREPFDHPDWQFEIKWDGFRMIACLDGGNASLKSRNNADYTERFSCITNGLQTFSLNAIFDGEVVTLDEKGCPNFAQVMAGKTE